METLIPIIILFIFVTLFGAGLIFLASKTGFKAKKSDVLQSSYECGIEVQETETSKVSVKFYLTAILFILFDIEIIFMYPWAVSYMDFIKADHGLYVLLGMGVFLAIFIFGLFWEVKSRALDWD